MRLFQNSGIYASYARDFDARHDRRMGYAARRQAYLDDRFGAPHLLAPVLDGAETAFFTIGDDPLLQRRWAAENGLRGKPPLDAILLAQIEAHRTEVFYNLDPMRYAGDFVKRLPGCVRHALCWRAAPSPGADFAAYDRVLCNFPSLLAQWQALGWRPGYLSPACDPATDAYAARVDRPLDLVFVGGHSRHHQGRAAMLEMVAGMADRYRIQLHLDCSRLTRLAEIPLARLLPLARYRRSPAIRAVARAPVFGRALYELLGAARIVLNGAIDMAGAERGNMRCFEALGCGALMVSDAGRYPEGFEDGRTMRTYAAAAELPRLIEAALSDWPAAWSIAQQGHAMIRTRYSKAAQWRAFQAIVAQC